MLSRARELAVDDLTEEIGVMRERLHNLLDLLADKNIQKPGDIEFLATAARTLARLMATHFHMGGSAADRLVIATSNVMDDIRHTLGLAAGEPDD